MPLLYRGTIHRVLFDCLNKGVWILCFGGLVLFVGGLYKGLEHKKIVARVFVEAIWALFGPGIPCFSWGYFGDPRDPLQAGSSIDMYNNDGGKKFTKQTGALKTATLYFAS